MSFILYVKNNVFCSFAISRVTKEREREKKIAECTAVNLHSCNDETEKLLRGENPYIGTRGYKSTEMVFSKDEH